MGDHDILDQSQIPISNFQLGECMKKLIFILLIISYSGFVFSETNETIRLDEMKKVFFLQGNWEGEGWYSTRDAQKHYFSQTENVQSELNGLVMRIEGIGKDKNSKKIIHHAFAVIHYDTKNQKFKMHSYKDGGFLDAQANVDEDGSFIWEFNITHGQIRFTIRLNDKGQWHEIGEFSHDGKTWSQNFEMTLDKIWADPVN